MEQVNGAWKMWQFDYLTNDELPGDGTMFLTPWQYLKVLLRWMVGTHEEIAAKPASKVLRARVLKALSESVK